MIHWHELGIYCCIAPALIMSQLTQTGVAGSKGCQRVPRLATLRACSTAQQQQQQQQGPDISRLHPLLRRQWDHPKNLHLGNIVITPGMQKKVWLKCDGCPAGHAHSWQAMVGNRTTKLRVTSGNGCPFCNGKAVCAHNSLAVNDPVVAAQWSDKTQTDRKTTQLVVVQRKCGIVTAVETSGQAPSPFKQHGNMVAHIALTRNARAQACNDALGLGSQPGSRP